jgi:hypothetical protein
VNKRKAEIWILVGLVAVGALVYFFNRDSVTGEPGVSAAAKFSPLAVQEPQLRLDLLAKLQHDITGGSHRNIFTATPPPVELTPAQKAAAQRSYPTVPTPTPPPPVQVPGEFFGYAFRSPPGKRFGLFKNGDDVLVVAEGDTFLNNYRLIHIGNDSADVEEISTGRHARVAMIQPPANGGGGGGEGPGAVSGPGLAGPGSPQ